MSARKRTETIFDDDDTDDDDTDDDDTDDDKYKTPMPALDGDSDDDSGSLTEGKEEEPFSRDTRLSLIATPVDERAQWESEDDEFIAPEGDATVYGDGDDDDYVPTL